MKQYAKVTPEGSRDLLFEECDDRRRVENALTGLYEANGYRKVITPTLEFFDVFNSGDAGLDADEMYKLTDNILQANIKKGALKDCLLYTSDAADE